VLPCLNSAFFIGIRNMDGCILELCGAALQIARFRHYGFELRFAFDARIEPPLESVGIKIFFLKHLRILLQDINALRFGTGFFKKGKSAINTLIEELSMGTAQIAKFPGFFSLGGRRPPEALAAASARACNSF
jgi:hypothetical protein